MTSKPTELQNWYRTHSTLLKTHPSFEFVGTPESGINHLIYHLLPSMQEPIWFEVHSKIAHDPVLTSNALVDAFNKAAGERVLDHGMHYPYVLNIIKRYTPILGHHTLIFSGTDLAPEFAQALLELRSEGHQVILIGEKRLSDLPLVTSEDLRLTREEATTLLDHLQLNEAQIREAFDQTRGVFEKYWIKAHQIAGRNIPLRPTANGMKNPPGTELDLEPRVLVPLLSKRQKHIEALAIAAHGSPELVLGVIEQAGTKALLTGAHEQLHVLLEGLPRHIKEDEVVMRWRIEAACLLGKKEDIRDEVLRYLEAHEAPDVRAVAVLYLIFKDNFFLEADRAIYNKRSLYTLKAKTFILPYSKESIIINSEEPFEALSIAEDTNNILEIIRCIRMIALYCNSTARYKEYLYWTHLGLEKIREVPNINAVDHLSIINSWLFSRIIQNKCDGIKHIIEEGKSILEKSNQEMRYYFESTLSDLEYVSGNLQEALQFRLKIWEESNRSYKCFHCLNLIKLLVENNENDKAKDILEETIVLASGVANRFKIHVMIAKIYLLLMKEDIIEDNLIFELEVLLESSYHYYPYIILSILKYIISINQENNFNLNDRDKKIVERLPNEVIKFYIGTKCFNKYFNKRSLSDITLKFMGKPSILINGKEIRLPYRQLEILSILSMNPEGLSGERLMIKVYGDDEIGAYGSLKTSISKLRKVIDIKSNPYRISINHDSDVKTILSYIKDNNFYGAVNLYEGQLLLDSECSEITEIRNYINEAMTSLALNASDIDLMIKVYEVNDDIRLLEKILNIINPSDPRFHLIKMRYKKFVADFG